MKSLKDQIGGDHYKRLKIQPIVFCEENNLTPCEANVVKYICRHRFKGGKQDIDKIRQYLDIIEDLYYNTDTINHKKDI